MNSSAIRTAIRTPPVGLSWGALLALALLAASVESLAERVDRIVSPGPEHPLEVAPGRAFSAVLRMRLPLTPPPGVQQSRAWNGWSAVLTREAAAAFSGAERRLEYQLRLVRVRPRGSGMYRAVLVPPAWIAEGRYDLEIRAPGFGSRAPRSVIVSRLRQRSARCVETLPLTRTGPGRFEIGKRPGACVLEIAIPADAAGVSVELGKRTIEPELVAWCAVPRSAKGSRDRVLQFFGEGIQGGSLTIERVEEARGGGCCIVWAGAEHGAGGIEQLEGVYRRDGESVSIAWDLGDGCWAAGERVRHRWMLDRGARVTATGFDRFGRSCTAVTRAPSGSRPERGGCGCEVAGANRAPGWSWRALIDVLIPGLPEWGGGE
ncbi:MAG: hypothetical protein R6V85_19045 [Polyangia bacterium]